MPSVVFAVIASSEESTMDARSAVWSSVTSVDRFDIIFSTPYKISGRMTEPRIRTGHPAPHVESTTCTPGTPIFSWQDAEKGFHRLKHLQAKACTTKSLFLCASRRF